MGVLVRELPKGSGNWYVMVNYKGHRRARKMTSKASAETQARKIGKKIDDGKFELPSESRGAAITLGAYAEKWMAGHVEKNLRPSTYDGYRQELDKHILPAFGVRPLAEITRIEVKEYCFRKLGEGLSGTSVYDQLRILSSLMNHAIEDGLRGDNPTARPGRIVKRSRPGEKAEILTPDEGRRLLETMRDRFPDELPLLLTFLRTGVRRGELLGLQWGDIDWRENRILVCRSIDKRGRISLPKNGRARRVDMSHQLAGVLHEHRARLEAEAEKNGRALAPWLFSTSTGKPLGGSNVWDRFQLWLKEAKIRHVRLHDLRHSVVSWLLAAGAPASYVKDLAGHSSIQITVDVYGHAIPGANRDVVNILDDPGWRKTAPEAASLAQVAALPVPPEAPKLLN